MLDTKSGNKIWDLIANYQNIPIAYFECDINGIFTISVGKGLEGIGLSPNQLVGLSVFDVYAESASNLAALKLVYSEHTNQLWEGEVGGRYFKAFLTPRYDAKGQFDGLIGFALDATEQIQLVSQDLKNKGELKKFQALYDGIISNLREGIILVDETFKIIYVNDRICNLLDYTPSEMIGNNLMMIVPDELHGELNRQQNLRLDGEPAIMEFPLKKRGGNKVEVTLSTAPIMDENNNMRGAFALIGDLTETKKLAKYYKSLSDSNQALIDALPEWGMVISKSGIIVDTYNVDSSPIKAPLHLGHSHVSTVLNKELAEQITAAIPSVVSGRKIVFDHQITMADQRFCYQGILTKINDENILFTNIDTTQKELLLNEREILLRELNHRVKNNFQVMMAIIESKLEETTLDETRLALLDIKSRMRVIVGAHQNFDSKTYKTSLEVAPYLESLHDYFQKTYRELISLQFAVISKASLLPHIKHSRIMDLGMIINELVFNSLKYAKAASEVADNRKLKCHMWIEISESFMLFGYFDDGEFFAKDHFHSVGGTGFEIINLLSEKMNAIASYEALSSETASAINWTDATKPRRFFQIRISF